MRPIEAHENYGIPMNILKLYENLGLCEEVKKVMGVWQYDDTDLERLSMIMTLHDIGFENTEIEVYMRLLLKDENTKAERLRMLKQKRNIVLDEIHFREKQLDHLDYLRHEINKTIQRKQK